MNQTQNLALTTILPDVDGMFLVPVDQDQQDVSHLAENEDFAKFLNRMGDYATAQANTDAQWDRRRKTVKLRKYVLGEYYGIFDKHRGWTSAKEEGDGIYFSPETPTFIENLLKDLIKTKPQKKCEPRDTERIDKREAARVAEKLLHLDDEQDSTPKRQQREWKWNLLTAGETYRITYFNPQKEGCGVSEEVYEPMVIEGGQSASYCPLCNSTTSDGDGKCIRCGNPQMDSYQALGTEITVKKGLRYKQIGDTDYDVPDALEMTTVGDTDAIAEALIVLRDRMIPRCVLEDALGEYTLQSTGTPESLQYKQQFDPDRNGADVKEFELLHYQELWLAPAVIASYKFPTETALKGGQKISAGTKGKDLFPKGLYFSRVKTKICHLYPQSPAECLSHTVNSIGEGFHGQGEWDLAELQDQATEAKSMKMNSMLMDSTQPLIVRGGYIDKEKFENKFGMVIEAGEEYPLEQNLENLMSRVKASNPPAEAYQLGEEIKGQMQQRVGAFSTQSDAPDIKAMGTATGIAAMTEQTLGRRAPALQLYAQMEVDQAYQKLELRQKYWCKKMYAPIAKELGTDAVKWFMGCNIRQDISISVVPNSWMPRTETQKQMGLQTFLSVAGQIIAAKGDPKMLDEVLRQANEVFGGGLNFNDYEKESVEAQLRLDKLREVGEFVEGQFGEFIIDPMTGTIAEEAISLAYNQTAQLLRLIHTPASDGIDPFFGMPMDAMFDEHTEFVEAYTDWPKTSEGRASSEFLRTLVHDLADSHIQAESYRTMRLKQYAMVGAAPDMQAELLTNEATHEQQIGHAQQDVEMQLENNAKQTEQDMVYAGVGEILSPAR